LGLLEVHRSKSVIGRADFRISQQPRYLTNAQSFVIKILHCQIPTKFTENGRIAGAFFIQPSPQAAGTDLLRNVSYQLKSQTHASLANHSWVVRQKGQYASLKNTGLLRNVSRSAWIPVAISRFVFGQRIINTPIDYSI
jgi:hypothetical protein